MSAPEPVPGPLASRRSRVAVIAALVVASLVSAGAVVSTISSVSRTLTTGSVWAEISLNPEDLEGVASPESPVTVEPTATSYGEFFLHGLPSDTLAMFVTADVVAGLTTLTCALVVALLCVAVLRRRGTWTVFTRATAALGLTLAAGGSISQWLAKQASDTASAAIIRQDDTWLEPGFLSGMSPAPLAVGLVLLALALCLRTAARFAADSDGLV
ncbi:hypothetical protein [Cellulosimicrobium cellulans]|uniref:hypothetical protein n=1 Tax=Cellulosimicrobium cellulans TaxID=1710 RepID=UPI001BA9F96D|nr:hypothetical protein [Cellulosimicrobium cellulans]QUC00409.1 hypothetical protein J5A69_03910 [Cellulosimicrobium cellulans]